MKKRFTEEQSIGILQEADARISSLLPNFRFGVQITGEHLF
jgi:hypothetical protein